MKSLQIRDILFITFLFFVSGCHTIFEEDITDQKVELLSPITGIETEVFSQTFWWTEVKGASSYRLQIVTPSFDSSEVLILDTLITKDKFTLILYPEIFQWRVRAENSVFHTPWTTGSLKIYSSDDLTRQTVNPGSPGVLTNSHNIRFEWSALYTAESYSFLVFREIWDESEEIAPITTDTTYLVINLTDGKYIWGVKANNSFSETLYSKKVLIVDSTPPDIPALSLPGNDSKTSDTTVSFSWISSDVTSGILYDSLKVYSDKNMTKLVKSFVTDNNSVQLIFSSHSTYYWTVRSVDKAGNAGPVSSTFSFVIS
jgi:hypothetical protein